MIPITDQELDATLTRGTALYSLRDYNSRGFPDEVTVRSVTDGKIHTRDGRIIPLAAWGVDWSTDWMTSLLAWDGGAQ